MKQTSSKLLLALCTVALFTSSLVQARQGATDPIPGTSNGATNSGRASGGGKSGGGNSSTPVPTPAPQPADIAIVTAPLTFSASGPINDILPLCTGSYHVDPYYPTLSLMTVDVKTSSLNLPDGTVLYIKVIGSGGTLYPFTSNAIVITGQSGTCSHSEYLTPGTTIVGVVITDAAGTIVFAGN